MQYRNLGRSGLRVSTVGLGGNNFGGRLNANDTLAVVHKALDLGVTFFDTADTYGRRGGGEQGASESYLGAALGARRKEIVLATKFGHPMDSEGKLKGASRSYMFKAIEESLKRLKTDWIDLYLMHSPDPLTPIEETMEAFDDLVRQGKVRYVGCSSTPAWGMIDANWTARTSHWSTFAACEDEYSLVNRSAEVELIPAAVAHGIGLLPYYPLASGLLSGKYTPGTPPPAGSRFAKPERFETRFQSELVSQRVEALREFASRNGRTLLNLAISWLAAQPVVGSVIAGATSPTQIEANVQAANWALTAEDLSEIDRITR